MFWCPRKYLIQFVDLRNVLVKMIRLPLPQGCKKFDKMIRDILLTLGFRILWNFAESDFYWSEAGGLFSLKHRNSTSWIKDFIGYQKMFDLREVREKLQPSKVNKKSEK